LRGYPTFSAGEEADATLAAEPKEEHRKQGKAADQQLISEGRPMSDELGVIVHNALA